MARQPIQRFIGYLMYRKGLSRDAAVLRASIARKNGWIPEKFMTSTKTTKFTPVSRKAEEAASITQPTQLGLFDKLGFLKTAESPNINQERKEGRNFLYNKQHTTTYKRGDDSPDKKKIVQQTANQVTVDPDKAKNILKDWKNSTVVADTTFGPSNQIDKVVHSVKRHSYILPGLETAAIRDRWHGITNMYGHDVRSDAHPILPKGQTMFQPEGLKKKELIKVNSLKEEKKTEEDLKKDWKSIVDKWKRIKKERPRLLEKWKATAEPSDTTDTYIKKKIRE